jgi:alpha-tubulin suppressor-like RCC1 family protein
MANIATQTITASTTWTAPAGVTSVTVKPNYRVPNYLGFGGDIYASFLLAPDGTIYRSGNNGVGQLGDNSVASKSSFVSVVGGIKFDDVANNAIGSLGDCCFGISNGKIYSWGQNSFGQLGDGTVVAKSSPVLISSIGQAMKVAVGSASIYALFGNNDVYAWGRNLKGELGVNDVLNRSVPTLLTGGLKFKKLYSGSEFAIGLTTSGLAYAWGTNITGNLGDGTFVTKSSPVAVLGGLVFDSLYPAKNLLTPNTLSVVGLLADGTAYSWGLNTNGQLGDNSVISKSSPVAVVGGLKFSKIINTGKNVFGLTLSGQLYAWGDNTYGQLGDGTLIPKSSPNLVLGGFTWKDILGASFGAMGLTTSGSCYAWGINSDGQLGDGTIIPKSSPVAVLGGLTFTKILSGPDSTAISSNFALSNNQVYGWGYNGYGQLGDGTIIPKSSPVLISSATYPQVTGKQPFPMPTVITVPITPGATYSINIGIGYSFFDKTPVSLGLVDSLTLNYEQ